MENENNKQRKIHSIKTESLYIDLHLSRYLRDKFIARGKFTASNNGGLSSKKLVCIDKKYFVLFHLSSVQSDQLTCAFQRGVSVA